MHYTALRGRGVEKKIEELQTLQNPHSEPSVQSFKIFTWNLRRL